jgi:replicative superfamily II helicase
MNRENTAYTGPVVLKQQRDKTSLSEPSGEAETLWGRINPKEMGSKYEPAKPPIVIGQLEPGKSVPKKKKSRDFPQYYQPKSRELTIVYESLLTLVKDILGDQPSEVLRGAVDELLKAQKEETGFDPKNVSEILGAGVATEISSQIINFCSKINSAAKSKLESSTSEKVSVLFEASSSEEEESEEEEQEYAREEQSEEKGELDLDLLAFTEGGHLMSNKKCNLPEGTLKYSKDGYEEIHVPKPQKPAQSEPVQLTPINTLPEWTRSAFIGTETLNRIQSVVAPKALSTTENLLICAPTGAGKTNIALLTLLNLVQSNKANNTFHRAIYIAPMKALVHEMVMNFSKKLESFGLKVAEMTGDQSLSRSQIEETFLIVTTPEKYDIITRKVLVGAEDQSFTGTVRLVIIDEVHLLHDERGPVLESLIARFGDQVRMIALSATLPNYQDIAKVIRAPTDCVFYFDSSYRPCPLAMQYVGIQEAKPIKRLKLMDQIVYEKLLDRANKFQVLIFVHSRKEAARTAKTLLQLAQENQQGDLFARLALTDESSLFNNKDLRELIPKGFGIHHAGLTRNDRNLVESWFANGRFNVLISTATLAWGVNLPAHTVIIKGTQIYSPDKGKWVELSPQDTLQMLGRAGRPQYDVEGEGIILTTFLELQYYLSLTNMQLPIESQMISKMIDCINSEIVRGAITDRGTALDWIEKTYLNIRMQHDPVLYGCEKDKIDDRKMLLIHSAFLVLDKGSLAIYEPRSGSVKPTDLGKIASYYYITFRTMSKFSAVLKPYINDIDLLRAFSSADEFRNIPVRAEEKIEMAKLLDRVPIPIKEAADDPLAKVNALLQCYISRVQIEGLALTADLVYISNSAGRLIRALFEICSGRGWSKASRLTLDFCKIIERRQWRVNSPLRQLPMLSEETLRRLERKDFPFHRLFDLDSSELSELVRIPQAGGSLKEALKVFPRIGLSAKPLPRRHDLIQVQVVLKPEFDFDPNIHQSASGILFHVFIEDTNRDTIIASRTVHLRSKTVKLLFELPIQVPTPPILFVSIFADRWLGADSSLAVNLQKMIIPSQEDPVNPILDVNPVPKSKIFPGEEGFFSVALSQALSIFSKSAVYSTGNSADYETAKLIFLHNPKVILNPKVVLLHDENLIQDKIFLFDKFDFETELFLQILTLKGTQTCKAFILLEQAANCQSIAEWISAEASVNFSSSEAFPVESDLPSHLVDFINTFIATGHINSKEDAVTMLTRTFFYQRLLKNPFYYGASGGDVSIFLSELVENACDALGEAGCIEIVDELSVKPLPLGYISAHYNVECSSIEMFSLSLSATSSFRNVFDIITASEEFNDFQEDEETIESLYRSVPIRIPSVRFSDPHTAFHISLQGHLGRVYDISASLLDMTRRLIGSLIDVCSCHSYLKPTLSAIELLQLLTQRQWPQDGPLYQLGITQTKLSSPYDLIDMSQNDLVQFCLGHNLIYEDLRERLSTFPNISVQFEKKLTSFHLSINSNCLSEWYVLLANTKKDSLVVIKKITTDKETEIDLEFEEEEEPDIFYLLSATHIGIDQEFSL